MADPLQQYGEMTPRTQQALNLSKRVAVDSRHGSITPAHLLAGILELGQGVAVNVFQKLGVDLETCSREVNDHLRHLPQTEPPPPELQFGDDAKSVMTKANQYRLKLHHTYLGTQHIAIALVAIDSPAADILRGSGLQERKTIEAIRMELDPNYDPDSPPEPWESADTLQPLYLLIDHGSAPPEVIAELLADISHLYQRIGGSGISFELDQIHTSEQVLA